MRRFFCILLVAVFSGELCAQPAKAAAADAEKPYAVESALAHKSRVADWCLDFDAALARAQRGGRLVCIVFAHNPESYVFGSGDAFAWSDRLVKKYVGENFECVLLPLVLNDSGFAPAAGKFSARHREILASLKPRAFPAAAIFNPKTSRHADIPPFQKTPLGFLDDFETAKKKLLEGYSKTEFLKDPYETISSSNPVGKYGAAKRKAYQKKRKISGWDDDFEAAEKRALKQGKMMLVYFSPGVDALIAGSKSLNSAQFGKYAKKALECVKVDMVREDRGVHKYLWFLVSAPSPFKEFNDDMIEGIGVEGYPAYALVDPKAGLVMLGYGLEEDPDEFLADLRVKIMEMGRLSAEGAGQDGKGY